MTTTGSVGQILAKGLGIKLENPEPYQDEVTRGESILSGNSTETFIEEPPTTLGYLRSITPSGRDLLSYLYSLFPFAHWIGHYNTLWLAGDLVAGWLPLRHTTRLASNDRGCRYYYRRCCRAAEYGVRASCQPRCPIRTLFVLHGCPDLLVLCDFKGYYYRRKYLLETRVSNRALTLLARCCHVATHGQRSL